MLLLSACSAAFGRAWKLPSGLEGHEKAGGVNFDKLLDGVKDSPGGKANCEELPDLDICCLSDLVELCILQGWFASIGDLPSLPDVCKLGTDDDFAKAGCHATVFGVAGAGVEGTLQSGAA